MPVHLLKSLMHSSHRTFTGTLFRKNMSTSTETGGVLPKPIKNRFGLIKVTLVVIPFLLFGGVISREGAAWLEEHDIFSPEDDD